MQIKIKILKLIKRVWLHFHQKIKIMKYFFTLSCFLLLYSCFLVQVFYRHHKIEVKYLFL